MRRSRDVWAGMGSVVALLVAASLAQAQPTATTSVTPTPSPMPTPALHVKASPVHSRHIPPGNSGIDGPAALPGACNVSCPKAGGGWKPLVAIPCTTTIGNACNAAAEHREPQPLPHARTSPSAADLLREHVHRENGRWVPNG